MHKELKKKSKWKIKVIVWKQETKKNTVVIRAYQHHKMYGIVTERATSKHMYGFRLVCCNGFSFLLNFFLNERIHIFLQIKHRHTITDKKARAHPASHTTNIYYIQTKQNTTRSERKAHQRINTVLQELRRSMLSLCIIRILSSSPIELKDN